MQPWFVHGAFVEHGRRDNVTELTARGAAFQAAALPRRVPSRPPIAPHVQLLVPTRTTGSSTSSSPLPVPVHEDGDDGLGDALELEGALTRQRHPRLQPAMRSALASTSSAPAAAEMRAARVTADPK